MSLRGFSSHVANEAKISRINAPIQRDMYEQAYKALKELEESKNSSNLLIEVIYIISVNRPKLICLCNVEIF